MFNNHIVTECLSGWVKKQPVKGWAKFTLLYPRFRGAIFWHEPTFHALREFGQRYPSKSQKKAMSHAGIEGIRRVVAIGGNDEQATAYHVHGLIEMLDDNLDRAQKCLTKAWRNSVRRYVFQKTKFEFYPDEASVWMDTFGQDAGSDGYVYYITRQEDTDLSSGIDKIILPLAYLTPVTPGH
jgi:hypothetical protein